MGIPESFKVGWYPPAKKLGRVTLTGDFLLDHFHGMIACLITNQNWVNAAVLISDFLYIFELLETSCIWFDQAVFKQEDPYCLK